MRLLFGILSLLGLGCTQSTYEVTDPHPTLNVTVLQSACIIDEPIYVQIKASQRGYGGSYKLAVILNEGTCDLKLGDAKLQGNGGWTTMPNASEVLTVIPRKTGRVRLMLEVMTAEGQQSGRNAVTLNIVSSNALTLDISFPATHTISKPAEIILKASKAGHSGTIELKYDPQQGEGVLQYGAVVVPTEGTFSVPANTPQTLYYTASARGTHRLQFAATDGYVTEYKVIEFIITN